MFSITPKITIKKIIFWKGRRYLLPMFLFCATHNIDKIKGFVYIEIDSICFCLQIIDTWAAQCKCCRNVADETLIWDLTQISIFISLYRLCLYRFGFQSLWVFKCSNVQSLYLSTHILKVICPTFCFFLEVDSNHWQDDYRSSALPNCAIQYARYIVSIAVF